MAEIYKVKTVGIAGFEKVQALKRILPEYARRPRFIRAFIDEARIAVELNHRNIVQVFDFGKADGELFLAMELIAGVSLSRAIRDAASAGIGLPVPLSCYILREVGLGLDYAHKKTDDQRRPLGIVHCDVSPQNIMLSREGFVKILDFGVARARFATSPSVGRLRGKPRYMAPEQARGDVASAATDVFSLAIVAWELLTGRPLFEGKDLKTILTAVKRAETPRVKDVNPNVPDRLSAAVERALSSEAPARGEAAGLARSLTEAAEGFGGATSRTLADWLDQVYPHEKRDEHERPSASEEHSVELHFAAEHAGSEQELITPYDLVLDDSVSESVELLGTEETIQAEVQLGEGLVQRASTIVTQTLAQLEEIDEEPDLTGPVGLREKRRVVAVVILIEGQRTATCRELARMLADTAYKRGGVVHSQDDERVVALFGLEVAGEDNVEDAMAYALDAVEGAKQVAAVADGHVAVRVGARGGIVAQPRIDTGYRLLGNAVPETEALAKQAEPGRPLLGGSTGRLTSTHFAFRELPMRRHRRQRMRVLELLGPRSFDERDRVYLERRGRFFGRKHELEQLRRAFDVAIKRRHRVTAGLTGQAGVGKSRLVAEFLARATAGAGDVHTIAVAATPAGQRAPFALITELFQVSLGLPPGRGEAARARLAYRLRHVCEQASVAREQIDTAMAAVDRAMELRDGALIAGVGVGADLREQLVVTVQLLLGLRSTDESRQITVVEDLHFGDSASLDILRTLLRMTAPAKTEMLLLTARPESEATGAIMAEVDTLVRISELPESELRELIWDRLGDAAEEQAVAAVAERAGGNPFFVQELAEVVRDSGASDIPSNARDIIVSRVDSLHPSAKAAMQYAAVIGRTFRAGLLEELIESDVGLALQELCDEELLTPADGASPEDREGQLRFSHGLIQEVVHDSLSASARRETHQKLGQLLASRYQLGREEPPGTIAHHLELGGEYAQAAAYFLRAGRIALAASDAKAAVTAFSKTLELESGHAGQPPSPASKARRREAHSGREKAYRQLGEHAGQAADLRQLERMISGDARWQADVQNRVAMRHSRLGEYDLALRATKEAERAAIASADERLLGEALRSRGEIFERQGAYDEALEVVGAAEEIFGRIDATDEVIRTAIGRGRIHLVRSQYEAALDAYRGVLAWLQEGGDPWIERLVRNHLAVIHLCLGQFDEAMQAAERALAICQRYGDRAREGDNLSVSATILAQLGQYESAAVRFEEALRIHAETGSRWSRADCLVYAGATQSCLGNDQVAIEYIKEGQMLARDIGARYIEANAGIALANALLRCNKQLTDLRQADRVAEAARILAHEAKLVGAEIQALAVQAQIYSTGDRQEEAVAASEKAMALLTPQQHIEGSEEEIAFVHYNVMLSVDAEEARSALKLAKEGLDRKLGHIRSAAWRETFVRAIPVHQSILRAAAETL